MGLLAVVLAVGEVSVPSLSMAGREGKPPMHPARKSNSSLAPAGILAAERR